MIYCARNCSFANSYVLYIPHSVNVAIASTTYKRERKSKDPGSWNPRSWNASGTRLILLPDSAVQQSRPWSRLNKLGCSQYCALLIPGRTSHAIPVCAYCARLMGSMSGIFDSCTHDSRQATLNITPSLEGFSARIL